MAKKKEFNNVKLSAFPEEVDGDGDGLKWYGEMSYETQMAMLSHYIKKCTLWCIFFRKPSFRF